MEHTVRYLAPVDVIYDDETDIVTRVIVLDTEAMPDSGQDADDPESAAALLAASDAEWPAWEMGY